MMEFSFLLIKIILYKDIHQILDNKYWSNVSNKDNN